MARLLAELAVMLLILVLFILLGILFDIVGVAVTAADEKPATVSTRQRRR